MSRTRDPVIHVHEDDWGMRNLHPLAAQREVAADLDEAIAASERNRDPSGVGWTDVHLIAEPATSYVEAGLLLSDAAAALEPIMPRVRHFHATSMGAIGRDARDPWGSYDDDAWCFGFHADCYLKLDVEGEHVKRIWFGLSSNDPAELAALRRAMLAIEGLVPSFIADYFMEAEVPLADTERLDGYFDRRRAEIEEFERRWSEGDWG